MHNFINTTSYFKLALGGAGESPAHQHRRYGAVFVEACTQAGRVYNMSVDAELKQCLIEMEERIVTSLKAYVNERSEIVETRLLTEFHKWASPAEARNRTISAALRAIDMEMEFISDRVTKLEGKQPQ